MMSLMLFGLPGRRRGGSSLRCEGETAMDWVERCVGLLELEEPDADGPLSVAGRRGVFSAYSAS